LLGRAVPGASSLTSERRTGLRHAITSFTASRLLNEWQHHRAVVKRRGGRLLAPSDWSRRPPEVRHSCTRARSRLRWRNDCTLASCHPSSIGCVSP
jgi:hypothetical protein